MDESSFQIPTDQIPSMAARFPAHPLVPAAAHPQTDLDWLATGPDFSRHAWDESGQL